MEFVSVDVTRLHVKKCPGTLRLCYGNRVRDQISIPCRNALTLSEWHLTISLEVELQKKEPSNTLPSCGPFRRVNVSACQAQVPVEYGYSNSIFECSLNSLFHRYR